MDGTAETVGAGVPVGAADGPALGGQLHEHAARRHFVPNVRDVLRDGHASGGDPSSCLRDVEIVVAILVERAERRRDARERRRAPGAYREPPSARC